MTKPPTFEELLASARHSAVHLEMRDGYMTSDPAYIAWQSGVRNADQDNDPEFRDWLTWVREATDRGVMIRRPTGLTAAAAGCTHPGVSSPAHAARPVAA